ncbi:molybdopterin-binding oxidoreductase [Halobiforma lacisalsi AJ5]|uniref:Molybdopterin-binding oxidoreductase n=1 Tax=Natronobacterium lacisalsi AJ5 TaxID=358396 RepID=M0LSC6_NATLA|nr:molybdopterin-dependent oxidoreductase [Halobiforma lacisalsi]APW99812.1 molybdopterin-binding oxidoreductase [Halobiforma lacisalsi AJ5]EMA36008.1 oxidoreductase molybdopterin binding protein [Halobiforma lacisalsi AJ5]
MPDTDLRPSLSEPIRILGDEAATMAPETLADLPVREREIEIVCSTGDRYTDHWQGVAIMDVLETEAAAAASIPAETTHLLVESADGHRACVALGDALDGLLAFGRDGDALGAVADYDSRFVAPGLTGPRTVKDVVSVEATRLEPGEDPESYERLLEVESEDGADVE